MIKQSHLEWLRVTIYNRLERCIKNEPYNTVAGKRPALYWPPKSLSVLIFHQEPTLKKIA